MLSNISKDLLTYTTFWQLHKSAQHVDVVVGTAKGIILPRFVDLKNARKDSLALLSPMNM